MDKHCFKTFPEDKVYHWKIKYSAGSGVLVVSEAAPGTHNVPTNGPRIGTRNVAAELVFSKFDIDVDCRYIDISRRAVILCLNAGGNRNP